MHYGRGSLSPTGGTGQDRAMHAEAVAGVPAQAGEVHGRVLTLVSGEFALFICNHILHFSFIRNGLRLISSEDLCDLFQATAPSVPS